MSGDDGLQVALRRHVAALTVEIGSRPAGQPAKLAAARHYVTGAFADAGLAVRAQTYDYHGQEVANVIAAPDGAPDRPDYYLIGAHYDTVPGTPGADDNASAVAVLLEVARRAAARPPPIPLRFVAFTLEEPPNHMTRKQGSRVFVRGLEPAKERVLGALVLEMVGFTSPRQDYPFVLRWAGYPREGNYIGIIGNRGSRRFGRAVLKGFQANPRLPVESIFVPFNGWVLPATRLSDHASFWDRGWPAVMVTDTAFMRNPHYHLPSDTMETLDFAFMAEVVRSVERALDELARVER